MSLVKDKDGTINIRLVILLIVIFSGVVAAIFYFPPVPTRTAEALTNGSINFTDKMGKAIAGTIEVSIAGSTRETRANVNSVNWNDIPNARISFSALETAHASINFRISGDSPDSNVTIEDHGMNLPGNTIRSFPPGSLIKYVEISQQGVSFSEAVITIKYSAIELRWHDETSLSIYRHDGTNWVELPSVIDTTQNTVSATVNELSLFALVAKPSENIEVIDTGKAPVVSEISTYDENRQLIKRARTDFISSADIPSRGDIEVDALETKNVAVRLKLKAAGGGKVILDDHGRNNPVSEAAPGNAIKYVDISAPGFDLESAEVRIRYTDEELGSTDENALVVYHWNGAAWEALPTAVDAVNNVLTAATMSLSPFAVSGGAGGTGKILVATNRYVILDDPLATGKSAQSAENFTVPPRADWTSNYWTGFRTQIMGYALLLDENGKPINNTNVTFTLRNWDNSVIEASTNISTDMYGLANYTFDMNARNYYGRWNITANAVGQSKATGFIYNWFGCQAGGTCSEPHGNKNSTTYETPADRNSPYTKGAESITGDSNHNSVQSDANCVGCHRSYSGVGGSNTFNGQATKTSDVHVTNTCVTCHGNGVTHQTDQPIKSCNDCHNRTDISMKSTKNGIVSNYSNSTSATYNKYHTPNSTVPCIICHGPMHNISKSDITQRFIKNNDTESSQCTTCHSSYSKHNASNITSGGVNCTLCHSDDAHAIQVFSQNATYITLNKSNPNASRGNCTNCHQNATFFGLLKNTTRNPKAGNYTGRNPPLIQVPVNHSNDPFAGKKWNQTPGYWTNTSQITWCKYCHGETNHKSSALGRPSLFNGSNSINASISSSSWCQQCHWQGASNYSRMVSNFTDDGKKVPPEITGNATYKPGSTASDGTNYYTHSLSDFLDNTCRGCHSSLSGTAGVTLFIHNVAEGGGGPDCISCHDIGKTGANHRINNSAMNSSSAIHRRLNNNTPNSSGVSAENKKCWGCHQTNGTQPTDMGDRYANPYKCYDCHNATAKPYANVSSALNVSEHFKNGTDIIAAVSAANDSYSCTVCHNLSEMKVNYIEDDIYNSSYSLPSHYGKNRSTDIRIGSNTNCSYCHQNTTSNFYVAMSDLKNLNISSHSLNQASLTCTNSNCHNSGLMHDINLTKPALTIPNSSYCLNCHGTISGNATIRDLSKHNNSVNCTQCHLSSIQNIHPVQYLQPDGTFRNNSLVNKTSAVNCTNCHQNSTFWSGAPIIPNPLKHSSNLSNGTIWGTFWTSSNGSCYYCHSNTKHNATAMGRISSILAPADPNNTRSGQLGSTTFCADCHYNDTVNVNYKGNQWSPIPPLITINNTVKSYWVNHSDYLSGGYKDDACSSCHALNGSFQSTSLNYSHSLNVGQGSGPNCLSCHIYGASGGAPLTKRINDSSMRLGVHKNLNSNATNSTVLDALNKACWACHGDGTEPTGGHPANYNTPWACVDCHNLTASFNSSNNTLQTDITRKKVTEHIQYPYNESINSAVWNSSVNCYFCHNKSKVSFIDSVTPNNSLAANVSHYANTSNLISPSKNCALCHKSPVNSTEWQANLTRHPAKTQDVSFCANCHNNTNETNLHSQALENRNSIHGVRNSSGFDWENDDSNETGAPANDESCWACHGSLVSTTNPRLCENCHLPNTTSKFTGPYNSSFYNLRSDINNTLPYVYSHTNYSNLTGGKISVPSQYAAGTSYQTGCYGYNATTGASTCHANSYFNRSNSGGYYGQWNPNVTAKNSDPAHWTRTIDRLPNTTNCIFCHNQTNATIRNAWGNATQINGGTHTWYTENNVTQCWNCHVADGTIIKDFHSANLTKGGGSDCISCHDMGMSVARINASSMRLGVHKNLNSNATNSTSLDPLNKACWACHGNGIDPGGHPANYKTPWSCESCHNRTSNFTSSNGTLQTDITRKKVTEHIKYPYNESINSAVWNTSVTCIFCHNKSKVNYTDLVTLSDALAANVSHYANTSNLISPSTNCALCHKSPANSTEWQANLTRHPAKTQNVSFCDNCHNTTNATSLHSQPLENRKSIHGVRNSSGFDWENDDSNEGISTSANDESCWACHGSVVSTTNPKLCENCHLPNTTSKFTGPFNGSYYKLRSDINDTLPYVYSHTNYSNLTGSKISVPSQYAAGTSYQTGCYGYNATTGASTCHANSYFNRSNSGGYYGQWNPNVTAKNSDPAHWTRTIDRLPNTTNCIFCHNQTNTSIRNAWGNATQMNGGTHNWYTGNDITQCWACHVSGTIKDFHSANMTITGGGPDCVSCHDIGRSAPAHVNVTAANDPNAIHKNMNSGASASNASAYYANNKRCWFCHGDNGTEPSTSSHPSRYKTPRRCPDCHLPVSMGGLVHNNGIASCNCHFNIPHPLRSHLWNGTNIFTPAVTTCYDCHNKSEMLVPANDPDNGTGAVYGGSNGGNNSSSHYGKKRVDLIIGGNTNCSYCHQNTTTTFVTAMIDPSSNSSISNHSLRYNSSNPSCTSSQCHNTGRIHDQTLSKPNITLPNSVYCLNCHGDNGVGGTNYSGMVTGIKGKHNNTLNCSECHFNSSRDIHPMKYLQANASYNTNNSSVVNCVICHQSSAVDANLTGTPVKVSSPLHHSDNPLNGSIWGPYWTNNSPQTACIYCHNDTKHNATPLGRILQWSPNYTLYRPISSNYTCSNCHYKTAPNYSQMNLSFGSAGLPIPPEINNGTDWNGTISGYYNHILSTYTDVTCKTCHGKILSPSANMSEFLHNVAAGGECKSCHFDYTFMNNSGKPARYVNSTMYNNSPHISLRCEDCHTGGHNNIGKRKACEDCHAYQQNPITDRDRHNITGTPSTYFYNGTSVVNITDCTVCHDATLLANATSKYGPPPTFTKNCDYCHTYPDRTYS